LLEVPLVQFGIDEKRCHRQKIVGGPHNLVTFTDQHVKLALPVNAVYSVEACPIQVYYSGGTSGKGLWFHIPHLIIVITAVRGLVLFQQDLDGSGIFLDSAVDCDQILVKVAKYRLLGPDVKIH
jgi:hypothetical protein